MRTWKQGWALLVMSIGVSAMAQGVSDRPQMPERAAIDEAMKKAGQALQDAEKAQQIKEEARKKAGAAGRGAMPSRQLLPNVDALAGSTGVDPAKLAEKFEGTGRQGTTDERMYRLVVFASLSMPRGSLERLGRDVKKAGGVMVLRGLKYGLEPGTWSKSMAELKPIAESGVEFQINPALFDTYQVRSVPLILVSAVGIADKGCPEGQCASGPVARIHGDVSLDYALETLIDRRDGVGRVARELSARLNAGPGN